MKHQWSFDNNAMARFRQFVGIVSPSMDEIPMASFLRDRWKATGAQVNTDRMGNVYASFESEKEFNVGIVAHMDTVAVQITRILPNGMLQFRYVGLRPHTLLGQPMKVVTRNGIIDGVIGHDPTSQYGQPKGLVEDDLWMDIGANGFDHAASMVQVGDLAVFSPRLAEMGNDFIYGTAIDDRIGLFIMDECLTWFAAHPANVNLHFIGSVQEEVGLRGAAIVASNVKLDACLVLDVDYATDTPTPHDNQMGTLNLGEGVGLHRKSDNNPVLRRMALDVAMANDIAHQMSLGRYIYGGTDAATLQIQRMGIAALNLNVPCRYMHSPVEMCHKRDVENCVRLLVALIDNMGCCGRCNFIPGID